MENKNIAERRERVLPKQVEALLRNDPPTRDSDHLLTLKLWHQYYHVELVEFNRKMPNFLFSLAPSFDAIVAAYRKLPTHDAVKRLRAAFNAEGKYYPTSWEVAKRRGILEDEWRVALGYPAKAETAVPSKGTSYMDPVPAEAPKLL